MCYPQKPDIVQFGALTHFQHKWNRFPYGAIATRNPFGKTMFLGHMDARCSYAKGRLDSPA
jgi:hypothetical protein